MAGDHDQSPLSFRGPDWFTDAHTLAPATPGNCLLTVFGGEHLLGGISGFAAAETTNEDPARVAAAQQLTWAYLRSAFHPSDHSWATARAARAAAPRKPVASLTTSLHA